ncbi:MAG: hypothetical protein ACLPVY_06530 [Acidimicrobiia bacterium]
MRLYHWTTTERAVEIRSYGLRGKVWTCDDRNVWKLIDGVCFLIDVPNEQLNRAWAPLSQHPTAQDWCLPLDVANRWLVR